MADEFVQQHQRGRGRRRQRVPVLLVEVVTRHDPGVGFPQLHGPFGVALEADGKTFALKRYKGKDAAACLEHERIRPKGQLLGYARL